MGDKNPQKTYCNSHYKLSLPATGDRGSGVYGTRFIRNTRGRGSVGNSNPTTITASRIGGSQIRNTLSTGGDSGFISNNSTSDEIRGSRTLRTVTRGRVYRGTGVRVGSTQKLSKNEESNFISRGNGIKKSDDLPTTRAGIYLGSRGRGGGSTRNILNGGKSNLAVEPCKGCNGTGICSAGSSPQTASNSVNSSSITRGNGIRSGSRGSYSARGGVYHGSTSRGRGDSTQNWRYQPIQPFLPKSKQESSFLPTRNNKNDNNLIGNYFILHTTGFPMYHYSVKIQFLNKNTNGEPKDALPEDCRKIIRSKMDRDYSTIPYVHDHANLYTVYRLPHHLVSQTIRHVMDRQVYLVKLEAGSIEANRINLAEVNRYYASKKNGGPEFQVSKQVLTVYNLIFRNLFEQKYTEYGGGYYDFTKRNENVQEEEKAKVGIFDLVSGFTASVVMTQDSGLALKLALGSAAAISSKFTCSCTNEKYMYAKCTQTLDRFVQEFVTCTARGESTKNVLEQLSSSQAQNVSEFVKDLKFMTRYYSPHQLYTIKRVTAKKPEQLRYYSTTIGREATIKDYYEEAFNLRVKSYPLVFAVRNRDNKEFYIPMELCHLLPDQFVLESKVSDRKCLLPKESPALSSEDYLKKVVLTIKEIKRINFDFLGSFQIGPVGKPMEFPYRVLPLPQAIRLTDVVRLDGKSWCVVNFDLSCSDGLRNFIENCFRKEANKFGIYLDEPVHYISYEAKDWGVVRNVFANVKKKIDPKFVLVVVPGDQPAPLNGTLNSEDLANLINYYVDREPNDIMIHMIKGNDVMKYQERQPAFYEDMLLTIKGKLGRKIWLPVDPVQYIPQRLPFKMTDTMVVGVADCRGFLAAVGSTDQCMTNFACSLRAQERAEDIVNDLELVFLDQLVQYKNVNHFYPKSLIVFRYGTQDRKFGSQMKDACSQIGHRIKMTVIAVEEEKRHGTRFALKMGDDDFRSNRPTRNVQIGTVVDSVMEVDHVGEEMHIFKSHFTYIDSLAPTKYVLLRDDHVLSTQQLQLFCNFACCNSVGTQQILSIPTVALYAYKCAVRCKNYFYAFRLLPENADFFVTNEMEFPTRLNIFVERMNEKELRIGEANKNRLYYL